MSANTSDLELDCRGLNCPMPIIKTKKAMDTLASGQTLKMVATDPGSCNDMAAWARATGNVLLSQEQVGEAYVFYVKKT